MTSEYDSISDTDQRTSMISETSDNIRLTDILRDKKITSHYAKVDFYITTPYASSPSTGDNPIQYSGNRPNINAPNIEVVLINITIYIINCYGNTNKYNNIHHQLVVVVIMMLSREPHNTLNTVIDLS